jgi:septum formation protein
MKNILYIASQSASRKKLLEKAGIPFTVIEQNADESKCDWNQPLQQVVESIAQYKMDHVIMPAGKEGDSAFVVTADTLSVDATGALRGKPTDWDDAVRMLKLACSPNNECGTAFCLEKKIFKNGQWQQLARIIGYAHATYDFYIPEACIPDYIKRVSALEAAGAIKIENGAEFVKAVHGSYTAIVGLPMFELRQALMELGFF